MIDLDINKKKDALIRQIVNSINNACDEDEIPLSWMIKFSFGHLIECMTVMHTMGVADDSTIVHLSDMVLDVVEKKDEKLAKLFFEMMLENPMASAGFSPTILKGWFDHIPELTMELVVKAAWRAGQTEEYNHHTVDCPCKDLAEEINNEDEKVVDTDKEKDILIKAVIIENINQFINQNNLSNQFTESLNEFMDSRVVEAITECQKKLASERNILQLLGRNNFDVTTPLKTILKCCEHARSFKK